MQSSALLIGCGALLLSSASPSLVWLAVLMAGFSRDGFMAIFMTAVIESEGIGPAHAGAAVGFVMVFSALGTLLSPLAGNSLASIGPGAPFFLWALLAALSFVLFAFVREGTQKDVLLA